VIEEPGDAELTVKMESLHGDAIAASNDASEKDRCLKD
jgi:hypothetical protein